MEDNKKMYQLFVVVTMLVLLTGGILIGLAVSKDENTEAKNEDTIMVQDVSNKEIELYNEQEEQKKDIEILYVDIYDECNHVIEKRTNEYNVNAEEIKERELSKIESEDSGYRYVKSTDENVLMFEKVYNVKCNNHYMLKYDNDVVTIYRCSTNGEYEKYQETEIFKESVRPDLSYRLENGIEAETLEDLYMFLEELES